MIEALILVFLWQSFWWFLPTGVANMMPVIVAKLPGIKQWESPVDGGMRWQGKRIFGDHKTWRGLVSGTIAAMITAYGVSRAFPTGGFFPQPLLDGFVLGLGGLGGDMVKSFFKRRNNCPPGTSWFPWDQLDYIIGGILLSYPLLHPPLLLVITTACLYFFLHIGVTYVGYLLRFKKDPL